MTNDLHTKTVLDDQLTFKLACKYTVYSTQW